LNLCEIDGAGVDVLRMDRKLRDQETLETVKAPGLCDQIHRGGPFALGLLFGFAGFLGGFVVRGILSPVLGRGEEAHHFAGTGSDNCFDGNHSSVRQRNRVKRDFDGPGRREVSIQSGFDPCDAIDCANSRDLSIHLGAGGDDLLVENENRLNHAADDRLADLLNSDFTLERDLERSVLRDFQVDGSRLLRRARLSSKNGGPHANQK
jgi:hypothetical protein